MKAELVYQRWLEVDIPEGVPAGTIPMWTWPVGLSDGRTILTLLYRPLTAPKAPRFPVKTQVLELTANGDAAIWPPSRGYPLPVIFYANAQDDLFGLDLFTKGKVYVCRSDGRHCWTLETTIRMDCPIAPTNLLQTGSTVYWTAADGVRMAADVQTGTPLNVRRVSAESGIAAGAGEVRFPYTHLTTCGSLYIVDFDPILRVNRYKVITPPTSGTVG